MGKTKVVLDTNVLISSLLKPGSKARQIYRLALRGEIKLYISKPLLNELERVLEYPKFEIEKLQKELFLKTLKQIAVFVYPRQRIDLIKEDPPDNRVLECGVGGKAGYIISGDKGHLLPLREYEGIKIVSPAEFLKQEYVR